MLLAAATCSNCSWLLLQKPLVSPLPGSNACIGMETCGWWSFKLWIAVLRRNVKHHFCTVFFLPTGGMSKHKWLLIYGNNLTIDSCLLDFVQNGISIIEEIHANPWMQTFLDWMIGWFSVITRAGQSLLHHFGCFLFFLPEGGHTVVFVATQFSLAFSARFGPKKWPKKNGPEIIQTM